MNHETIVFGGGCFWCTEAVFQKIKGVVSVTSGYAGGKTDNPSYYDVSEGKTGHTEVVEIVFDPTLIHYKDLLAVFFAVHDPTSLNKQGYDVGDDYRSVIFYTSEKQKKESEETIKRINDSKEFDRVVVTEIVPLIKFYTAEEYHQNFYHKNPDQPYCTYIIVPKLEKLKLRFENLLK